jgi:asparagine synthase (glutamine-hydrolysing)
VLLGDRAIFGAVAFGAPDLASRRVDDLVDRAQRLGARTEVLALGRAVLGAASRDGEPAFQTTTGLPCTAIVAGEVFNGPDLLLELQGTAAAADTCPGRILTAAYSAWGIRCFGRVDGAYAAAIWDAEQERLTLACDRRADAHLYYHASKDIIVFSSWLALLPTIATGIARDAVKEFLRFLYIAAPHTIYEGVAKLPPGSHLVASAQSTRVTRHPQTGPSWQGVDLSSWHPDEILETFETLLHRSIRRRFRGRRTGIFLSSGVDSGTITAATERLFPGRAEALTVAFDDPDLDESRWAQAFSREVKVAQHIFTFGLEDYEQAFDDMSSTFDQPAADPAGLPILLTCQRAAPETELFSGGTGGDDLFGAPVPRHLRFSLALAARVPRGPRRAVARTLRALRFIGADAHAPLFDFDEPEELLVTWPGWTRTELDRLYGEPTRFEATAFYQTFRSTRPLGIQEAYDALGVFPPDDCRFEAAGAVGRLIHFPYHEAELVSFVQSLPPDFRTSGNRTKVLLRRLFARYAPEAAGHVKKRYFNLPLDALLAHRQHALVRRYLDPAVVERLGLVDPAAVRPYVERFLRGDRTLLFKVWALLVLHGWVAHRS